MWQLKIAVDFGRTAREQLIAEGISMPDWIDKLEDEYRTKRQKDDAELQRRSTHDNFIQSHGHNAWKELVAKVNEAYQQPNLTGWR